MVTDQLYRASEALPNIPNSIERQSLNTLTREYSIRNKFVVSVTRSDAKKPNLSVCQKWQAKRDEKNRGS
ncbi:hypothetical protein A0J61_10352 [Choanephora cucurbitarum]|uniref:Uncharacterized protein n=1 Tax=Choanephora cucurbitarum TaxID=101091 RepID=A0A1C7MXQ2_9FUNG|nr:hypothetical protein A0J61_10352 [Choanephora cucurbitarum]